MKTTEKAIGVTAMLIAMLGAIWLDRAYSLGHFVYEIRIPIDIPYGLVIALACIAGIVLLLRS
ncbi:MAG: hypothetical protein ACE5OY_02995 [Candidatus Bathyarchaeia archaeon]